MSNPNIIKLRLVLDVDYDISEGATAAQAREQLASLPSLLANHGLISGDDAPLLVDTWNSRVEDRA